MVDVATMAEFDPRPFVITDAGHNAHVERPEEFLAVLERELGEL